MKRRVPAAAALLWTILLVLFLPRGLFSYMIYEQPKELFREDLPDGAYTVVICEKGHSRWPFEKDHLEVGFFINRTIYPF